MRSSWAILASFALIVPGSAAAQVTKPFPGVTLVRHGGRALAVGDLCAPGVSVRATKYGERKRTPEQWAAVSGAAVAVNADFFDFPGATHVNGRARGAGEDWPAAQQFVELTSLGEVRSYWQFGPNVTELVSPSTNAPKPAATEIVGAHNVIIRGGKSLAPNFDGDGVILNAYRRTGIGVDATRSHVYLFASNDVLNGANMAATMIAYAAEAGAPPIDQASNEDGGGSSQMHVKGQGQIITSGRLVANHLGIMAAGSGASPMCPNKAPAGYLDAVDCDHMTGWAHDADQSKKATSVHFYFDGPPGDPKAKGFDGGAAAVTRKDLCDSLGSCEHGFDVPTPFGIVDGKEHVIRAYAIDDRGGANPELTKSGAKLTCTAKVPLSVKRPLSPAAFAAWKMDAFRDVLVLGDAALEALASAPDAAASPRLVQADDGSPEVWLLDGTTKRHVGNPTIAVAWHFDLSKVEKRPAAEVQALATGIALRARPWIVKATGDATFLLDEVPGATQPGDSPGPSGGTENGSDADGAEGPGDASGCATTGTRRSGSPASGDLVLFGALALSGALVSAARRRR